VGLTGAGVFGFDELVFARTTPQQVVPSNRVLLLSDLPFAEAQDRHRGQALQPRCRRHRSVAVHWLLFNTRSPAHARSSLQVTV
jgi:hypothetical protein